MLLLIDAANSRVKIACHDGSHWLLRSALDDVTQLLASLPAGFQPQRIVIANVAGPAMTESLQQALTGFSAPVEWLQASATRCGLRCDYAQPTQLGPDRWAAAIGAWQHVHTDCLVVCAGTATTVDIVRQPGIFAGGCILPGLDLMLESLSSKTAALPRAQGSMPAEALLTPPTETHAAIRTGCLHAQLGAIERMVALLPANAPILLAGGHAEALAPHLGARARLQPWLIMDGLLAIATESGKNATTGESS